MSEQKQEILFVIDGNSLMFRAYYAMHTPMTNSEGFPTGAIYGFLNMLFKLLERNPTHLAVAFDLSSPTFRHKMYEGYKAGRKTTPDELKMQMPVLQSILENMGIAVLTIEGFEADDILGTLSKKAETLGMSVLLVTGDRDVLQLISSNANVLLTKKGITDVEEMTIEALHNKYGLSPDKMIDLKALMGDSSDNIPGIPGIGEKTALKLLHNYGSLDGVIGHKEEIAGKLGERIRDGVPSALMSRQLGTIRRDIPIDLDFSRLILKKTSFTGALELLKKLNLKSIIARIPDSDVTKDDIHCNMPISKTVSSLEEVESLISDTDAPIVGVSMEDVFSFAFSSSCSYIVDNPADLFSIGPDPAEILQVLIHSGKKVLSFDAKKILHFSSLPDECIIDFDARIADYLLESNNPSDSLKDLCKKYFGFCSGEAAVLFLLKDHLASLLKERELDYLYYNVELKLLRVLFDMEREGFPIDIQTLDLLGREYSARQLKDEEQIFILSGEKFNILSTKQLGTILYDKLKLPVGRKTKTGYSTDSDTLEFLSDKHPIVPLIMDYRLASKLKATFIDGLINAQDRDGRIHSTFNQCVTATGRISSNDPNLQNIPTRTDDGKKIRRAFIASPGHVLVDADYSQIELRLLAHLCGDASLIDAFNNGIDIHTKTASEVFNTSLDLVTKEQRRAAKAVNFGIIYGISDFGLSKSINVSVKEAGEYIRMYLERYPSIQNYMKGCVEEAKKNGYAKTMWGRIRPVPELSSSNYNVRSFGERVAMNMPIQGTAADIIKIAMVRVHEALMNGGFKSKLVLQVHDELIIDAVIEEKDAVIGILRSCMENIADLKVKLIAEISVADNWADAK